MSRWFRFYDDVINDPKVLKLPEVMRWHWVSILCVASKNDGSLPNLDELAFYLRTTPAKATAMLAALVKAGLVDKTETGFTPHNWSGRQYKSDGSADRVKRHREKRAAAGLQAQWTPPKALRQAVYERDGYSCVYCGSKERLSLDHRTPEIRGGDHSVENLATACLSCNGAKRDMTETEYRESVTLLKRPQNTENREQNTVAKATGAEAPPDPSIAEREFFARGKQVLGKSAGGQLAKLKAAKGGNVALARAALEAASQAQNPAEYIAGVIRAGPHGPAKPLTEFQRKQQETNDVRQMLRESAAAARGGGTADRVLSIDHGGRPEGIRSGIGGDLLDLRAAPPVAGH